jgi:hypothetical protein
MDRIAQASREDRAELFRGSAAILRPKRSPAIIEKDFWVCWTLRRIYEILQYRPQLIFKGGTSLSKVYDAIERFSEDVDLSLSRHDLGFADERDPEEPGISRKEALRRIDSLVDRCKEEIHDRLLPMLRSDFTSVLGDSGWSVELDAADPQTIIFTYPRTDMEGEYPGTIRPSIRLELGARSDDWPAEDYDIRSYAAEAVPHAFTVAALCRVHAFDARRTFWEKATILHANFHRPADKPLANGQSRHYYDLCRLSQQDIGRQALERVELLERVVAHKRLFFASAWASYETATAGSFHLIPPIERMPSLLSDYARMREMIYGDVPSWEEIMEVLHNVENQINKM